MGKRIRLMYIVFFSIFLLGSVIAYSSLTSINTKIEKKGGVFKVYELQEIRTDKEMESTLNSKIKKLEDLRNEKTYFDNYYEDCNLFCVDSCHFYNERDKIQKDVLHNSLDSCISLCSKECDYNLNWMEQVIPKKINELQEEINYLKDALK